MKQWIWASVVLLAAALAGPAADTGMDPARKHAWGENTGWVDAGPPDHDVTIHYAEAVGGWLWGHAWCENAGWIILGSGGGGPYGNTTARNWGVNMAANGTLSGYAWGENVGWINFDHERCDAAIDPADGEFSGHAWGENVGWLTFAGTSPAFGVRTVAFDRQAQGTPNWWLAHYGITEDHDAGDGVAAWRKYVMDTDPTLAGDYLRINAVSNAPTATAVAFTPASPRRYYTLIRHADPGEGGWSNVTGQAAIQFGGSGEQTMQDTNAAAHALYGISVTLVP